MDAPVATKVCPDCNTPKPLADFYLQQSSADGHQTYCKPCLNIRSQVARKAKREQQQIPVTTPSARWPAVNAPRLHSRQYTAMLNLQHGVCAGCSRPETVEDPRGHRLPLSLYGNDTGPTVVRVLLCKMCTTSMSCARDDPGILGRLASIAAGSVRQEVRLHVEE